MTGAELPLLISCEGRTPDAERAAEVAAALAQQRIVEITGELDTAIAAGRAGRKLIVLDGCRSACRARVLEARGLHPHAALDLTELGSSVDGDDTGAAGLAAEVAARLRSTAGAGGRARPPRPPRPLPAQRSGRAHGMEDYLLAIDALGSSAVECGALAAGTPTLAAHVSRLLGVSRASAGEMLGRLESAGFVERGPRKELLLSTSGRAAADRSVRRHRLLERFVTDFLGYPAAESHDRARGVADALDDDAVDRLGRALGSPERCPHGWPIDPERARAESRELTAVSALRSGQEATVVRLAEHDCGLVARLSGLGIVPGAQLVAGRRPARSIAVQVDGTMRRLDPADAAEVFVRR
jgi:DtxR family transcriptional regulator, Mn-dependent transcriptional regulator